MGDGTWLSASGGADAQTRPLEVSNHTQAPAATRLSGDRLATRAGLLFDEHPQL